MSWILRGVLAAGALVAFVGCGGKEVDPNRPKTVPASVTIMYKGQPVEEATVALQPSEGQERGAVARTGPDGKAQLWTYEPGDGVIPGAYKVTVVKQSSTGPDPSQMTPEEYNQFAASGGGSVPPMNELPARYAQANQSDLTIQVQEGGPSDFTLELKD